MPRIEAGIRRTQRAQSCPGAPAPHGAAAGFAVCHSIAVPAERRRCRRATALPHEASENRGPESQERDHSGQRTKDALCRFRRRPDLRSWRWSRRSLGGATLERRFGRYVRRRESESLRSRDVLHPIEPGFKKRFGSRSHGGDRHCFFTQLQANLFNVVVIVGKRRVHVAQPESRVLRDDLVRRHAHLIVPDSDVGNTNPVACDARFPPADSRRLCDSLSHAICCSAYHVPAHPGRPERSRQLGGREFHVQVKRSTE